MPSSRIGTTVHVSRCASGTTRTLLACAVGFFSAQASFAILTARADDFAKQVPSEVAIQTKMALKLAGLVTFVASSCPEIKVDYSRFKSTINRFGASYDDLAKNDMKALYLNYAMRYKSDVKENCSRALANFGPEGLVVPHILTASKP